MEDSNNIYEIIEDRRKSLGLSQAQVSLRAFNRNDTSAIQNIKRGSLPSFEKLSAIGRVLGLECYFGPSRMEADAVAKIVNQHGETAKARQYINMEADAAKQIVQSLENPGTAKSDTTKFSLITLQNIQAGAGAGRLNGNPEPPSALAFNNTWLTHVGITPGKASLIYVAGDSMEPTLKNGSIVLIDHKQTQPTGKHIYAIRDGDELMVKRVEKLDDKTLLLTSDNPSYNTRVLTGFDLDDVAIVGRVVWSGFTVGP